MENCPKCKSLDVRKDGIVRNKQRFRCKACDYRFTVQEIGKPRNLKREAFVLYLEGSDYRTIGEVLKISHVTAFNWLKEFKKVIKGIKSNQKLLITDNEALVNTIIRQHKSKDRLGLLLVEIKKGQSNVLLTKTG